MKKKKKKKERRRDYIIRIIFKLNFEKPWFRHVNKEHSVTWGKKLIILKLSLFYKLNGDEKKKWEVIIMTRWTIFRRNLSLHLSTCKMNFPQHVDDLDDQTKFIQVEFFYLFFISSFFFFFFKKIFNFFFFFLFFY